MVRLMIEEVGDGHVCPLYVLPPLVVQITERSVQEIVRQPIKKLLNVGVLLFSCRPKVAEIIE